MRPTVNQNPDKTFRKPISGQVSTVDYDVFTDMSLINDSRIYIQNITLFLTDTANSTNSTNINFKY